MQDCLRAHVFPVLPWDALASASLCCKLWNAIAREEWPNRLRRWTCGTPAAPGLSACTVYGLRHKVDCKALEMLQDMQWPARRADATRWFRAQGADVVDILSLAARYQGPACLALNYWANHVLTQVKTRMAAEELRALPNTPACAMPAHAYHHATLQAALCIAAVHQPTSDVGALLHVLDQLAAEARLRLGKAAAVKAAGTQLLVQHGGSTASGSGGAGAQPADAGQPADGEDTGITPLTVQEALAVINNLLFGTASGRSQPAGPVDQEGAQLQPAAAASAAAAASVAAGADGFSGSVARAVPSQPFSIAPLPAPLRVVIPAEDSGLGLEGNREDFYSPSNSLLPDVLATGKGIPITLAIIHMAVCQRVGLDVQLVNLPMRVVNRVRTSSMPGSGATTPTAAAAAGGGGGAAAVTSHAGLQLHEAAHALEPTSPRQLLGQPQAAAAASEAASAHPLPVPLARRGLATAASTPGHLSPRPSWASCTLERHASGGSLPPATPFSHGYGYAYSMAGSALLGRPSHTSCVRSSISHPGYGPSGGSSCVLQLGASRRASCSLGWKADLVLPAPVILPSEQDVYVDLFAGGQVMDDVELRSFMLQLGLRLPPAQPQPLSPQGVAARMCANLCSIYHARRHISTQRLHMMLELATAATPGVRDLWLQRLQAALSVNDFADAMACVDAIQGVVMQDAGSPAEMDEIAAQMQHLAAVVKDKESASVAACRVVQYRPADGSVRFCVGQVVRNTQQNYRAVVYNWDAQCNASSQWMEHMQVEALPGGGAQQPFFCVLVDGRDRQLSRDYVPQCHLEPLAPLQQQQDAHRPGDHATEQQCREVPEQPQVQGAPPAAAAAAAAAANGGAAASGLRVAGPGAVPAAPPVEHPDLGTYFVGWDAARGCFVPNPSLQARFPEDVTCRGHDQQLAEQQQAVQRFLTGASW